MIILIAAEKVCDKFQNLLVIKFLRKLEREKFTQVGKKHLQKHYA